MFTGIVETVGAISQLRINAGCTQLELRPQVSFEGVKLGDSISVNGACLTVIACNASQFTVEFMDVTRQKTNLGTLKAGDSVNLERALKIGDRLDGHWVYGHVDGTVKILNIVDHGDHVRWTLALPAAWKANLIPQGSVTLDGVSLTVAALADSTFEVALISHTLKVTSLGRKKIGDGVNVELDVVGKYVVKQMNLQ